MLPHAESDSLLGLLISTSMRDCPIGPAIECKALAAPLDPDLEDDACWQSALFGTDSGIVQLTGAALGAGIVNHENASGLSIFLRLPGAQIEVPLAEANRVTNEGINYVRKLIAGSVLDSGAPAMTPALA